MRQPLSFNPKERMTFILNKITNKYHFILNSDYVKTDKLDNIYTILYKNDKIYKISFTEHKLL
jgi:hypothetical protein